MLVPADAIEVLAGESLQVFLAARWGVYARNAVAEGFLMIQQEKNSVAVHGCFIVLKKTTPWALRVNKDKEGRHGPRRFVSQVCFFYFGRCFHIIWKAVSYGYMYFA